VPDPPERDWLSPIEARNSASPTPSPVDKSRPFYQRRDVSPLTSNGQSCWQSVDILRRPPETGPVRSLRGRQREVSTARQRSRAAASSPDRSAGANRRPHGTDQPEAGACPRPGRATARGTTTGRTAPTTAVRCGRRRSAALHLSTVRTTQQRRKRALATFPVAVSCSPPCGVSDEHPAVGDLRSLRAP
jgi:hypothetical protein